MTLYGGDDILLMKYDLTTLQRVATVTAGFQQADQARAVAVDSLGAVFITGYVTGRPGSTVSASTDIVLSKYDANLNLITSTYAGSPSEYERATAIAIGHDGGVYVAGFYSANGALQCSLV